MAMYTQLLGAVINIVLNYVFSFYPGLGNQRVSAGNHSGSTGICYLGIKLVYLGGRRPGQDTDEILKTQLDNSDQYNGYWFCSFCHADRQQYPAADT